MPKDLKLDSLWFLKGFKVKFTTLCQRNSNCGSSGFEISSTHSHLRENGFVLALDKEKTDLGRF